jgi:hypothetical protein
VMTDENARTADLTQAGLLNQVLARLDNLDAIEQRPN